MLGQEHPSGAFLLGERRAGLFGRFRGPFGVAVGQLGVREEQEAVRDVASVAVLDGRAQGGGQDGAGLARQAGHDERLGLVEPALRQAFAGQAGFGLGEQVERARDVPAPRRHEREVPLRHGRLVTQPRRLPDGDGLRQCLLRTHVVTAERPRQTQIGQQPVERGGVVSLAEAGQGAGRDVVRLVQPSGPRQRARLVRGEAIRVETAQDGLRTGRVGQRLGDVPACREQADQVHPHLSRRIRVGLGRQFQSTMQEGEPFFQPPQFLGRQPGHP
ncbi:hypothetical protein LUX57_14400 [Actinomadura madurae]|uniref:hypothetical protein n=1 Tax=Actinomadura madurae TaxID=1993 RepID=UPI0020D2430B|nr:hypothetical protein [Actinomadura madurae]MCP9966154.1 hypothetical protein [Actinomadura madurae]